jgi:hypothetical protein
MPSDEKEVIMTPVATTEGTRKKRRPRRNKMTRSVDKTDIKGEAIVTKEEVIITKKPNETPKGIKVESQQFFKLIPKSESVVKKLVPVSASTPVSLPVAPVPVPTKITILPKKRVQKITILGKTAKKPVSDVKEKSVPAAPVKQKIVLPITAKKTRKQYKERKLRIDV